MLGIIFTGGEGPKPEIIKQCLDGIGSLFIAAADSGLVLAESAGIKPDIIIGDMDSVDTRRLESYPAESVIRHSADKDHTDTELAMQEAIKKGCDKIWIIGGGGGRLEHLFGIRSLFEMDIFPNRWITKTEDVYCIENEELIFKIDAGRIVSVFSLGDGPWEAKSTGLKWRLDGIKWNRGGSGLGLSNVAADGDFSVKAEAGRFLIIVRSE